MHLVAYSSDTHSSSVLYPNTTAAQHANQPIQQSSNGWTGGLALRWTWFLAFARVWVGICLCGGLAKYVPLEPLLCRLLILLTSFRDGAYC